MIQKKPTFALSATVRIRTTAKSAEQILSLTSPATAFAITVADKPLSVILDPDGDLFRRLRPEEIPASINSIKGADSVTVVIADGAGMSGKETARMLVRALGLSRARIIGETELGTAGAGPGARIYIGFPKNSTLVPTTLAPVQLSPSAVTIEDRSYIETTDIFFGVFADLKRSGQVSAILAPLHPKLGPIVARKVTHYGKYSYLVFRQGKNAEKGVWPVTKSPMIFRWDNL